MNPSDALYAENRKLRQERDELIDEVLTLREIVNMTAELLPCGHPRAAVNREGDTRFCRWCAEVDAARAKERERCAEIVVTKASAWAPYPKHRLIVVVCSDIASAINEDAK